MPSWWESFLETTGWLQADVSVGRAWLPVCCAASGIPVTRHAMKPMQVQSTLVRFVCFFIFFRFNDIPILLFAVL